MLTITTPIVDTEKAIQIIADNKVICTSEFVFWLNERWWKDLVDYEVSNELNKKFVNWGAVFYIDGIEDTLYTCKK